MDQTNLVDFLDIKHDVVKAKTAYLSNPTPSESHAYIDCLEQYIKALEAAVYDSA